MTITRSKGSNDPLRTLERLVGVIVVVVAVLAVLLVTGTVVGSGAVPGLTAEVCATGSGDDPAFRVGDATGPAALADGITWRADRVKVCDPAPDGTTRALAGVGLVAWIGAPVVFFVLLWRFLRRARLEGVFADRIPARLRTLGTALLGWAALDFVLSGLVDAALITRMTSDDTLVLFTADVPWLLVLLGLALLALAQVMAQAVDLRRDVEATI